MWCSDLLSVAVLCGSELQSAPAPQHRAGASLPGSTCLQPVPSPWQQQKHVTSDLCAQQLPWPYPCNQRGSRQKDACIWTVVFPCARSTYTGLSSLIIPSLFFVVYFCAITEICQLWFYIIICCAELVLIKCNKAQEEEDCVLTF